MEVVGGEGTYVTDQINIYRRSIVYLRTAEALAGLYKETREPKAAEMSFNMLKDAFKVFFPDGHVMQEILQPYSVCMQEVAATLTLTLQTMY